jgi:hypothetical protein
MAAQAVTLPTYIQEVLGWNLGRTPIMLTEGLRGFPQSFPAQKIKLVGNALHQSINLPKENKGSKSISIVTHISEVVDLGESDEDVEWEKSNDEDADTECHYCARLFSDVHRGQEWIRCIMRNMWIYTECVESQTEQFLCQSYSTKEIYIINAIFIN